MLLKTIKYENIDFIVGTCVCKYKIIILINVAGSIINNKLFNLNA